MNMSPHLYKVNDHNFPSFDLNWPYFMLISGNELHPTCKFPILNPTITKKIQISKKDGADYFTH